MSLMELGLLTLHSVPATREVTLRTFCFENPAKQILLHRAGGPKPVLMWMMEESRQKPQNVVCEWPEHRVLFPRMFNWLVDRTKAVIQPGH